MNHGAVKICGGALIVCLAELALAQQGGSPPPAPGASPTPASKPAVKSSAQIEAGEPRADIVPSTDDASAAESNAARLPAAPKAVAATPGRAAAVGGAGRKGTAADRINLNTATVTGDREQPKVMYVVPWKSPNIGDLSGKPMNSLLDEALAPVDREEFKREVVYYDAVRAVAPGAAPPKTGAAAAAAKQVER